MEMHNPGEDWAAQEARNKAHLNGAANNPLPRNLNAPTPPPVWGGWGQAKPRIRMPPALGRMGFPFVAPKPPPPTDAERRAVEFRRQVANMPPVSGIT